MIKQPDINSVFHPTFLGNRILASAPASNKSGEKNAPQGVRQVARSTTRLNSSSADAHSSASSDGIVINVHLSGHKILQHFGWILAACLWGLVFAFFLMR